MPVDNDTINTLVGGIVVIKLTDAFIGTTTSKKKKKSKGIFDY